MFGEVGYNSREMQQMVRISGTDAGCSEWLPATKSPKTSASSRSFSSTNSNANSDILLVMRRSGQAILSRSIRQSTRPWPRYTQQRHYAKRETPTLPTVELCPEPSCECRPTPEGLDIDHVSPMTKPYYDEHVIISTGTSDWSSRLDEDADTGAAYQALRYFLNVTPRPDGSRRFGEFYNVWYP